MENSPINANAKNSSFVKVTQARVFILLHRNFIPDKKNPGKFQCFYDEEKYILKNKANIS